MTRNRIFSTSVLITRLARIAAIPAMAVLLAGCSGYEDLAQDTLAKDYTVRGIRWTAGTTTLVFMKAFNNQGKLVSYSPIIGQNRR